MTFPEYKPTKFTFQHVNKPWADPELSDKFQPQWNEINGNVDRRGHSGPYPVRDGFPLNPLGRTGIEGKGLLKFSLNFVLTKFI